MRIELIARNYKVSDRLEEIINKKMEKFARYFEDDAVAKITMREVKNKYARRRQYGSLRGHIR